MILTSTRRRPILAWGMAVIHSPLPLSGMGMGMGMGAGWLNMGGCCGGAGGGRCWNLPGPLLEPRPGREFGLPYIALPLRTLKHTWAEC